MIPEANLPALLRQTEGWCPHSHINVLGRFRSLLCYMICSRVRCQSSQLFPLCHMFFLDETVLDYFQDTHKDGCLAHGQLIFCKWQPIICCNLAINQHWQGLPWSLGTFKFNPLHKSFKIPQKSVAKSCDLLLFVKMGSCDPKNRRINGLPGRSRRGHPRP